MGEKENVQVDLGALTIGDLELFDQWGRGEAPIQEVLDVLDRAVGGGVRQRPISDLREIVEAINEAVGAAANPKN